LHSPVSHRFFFHHRFSTTDSSVVHGRFYDGAVVVVDGVFSVNGDLTASGGGAGFCEGIRTGGSSIGTGAVVVVDGGFDDNGVLTASGVELVGVKILGQVVVVLAPALLWLSTAGSR
jgi:hypothetical protein